MSGAVSCGYVDIGTTIEFPGSPVNGVYVNRIHAEIGGEYESARGVHEDLVWVWCVLADGVATWFLKLVLESLQFRRGRFKRKGECGKRGRSTIRTRHRKISKSLYTDREGGLVENTY